MPASAPARFPTFLLAATTVSLAFAWRPAAAGEVEGELRPRVFIGDHDGFSRLVVQVPRGTGIRLEQAACGGRVVLSRGGDWPVGELNDGWLRRVWNFRPAEEGRALSFDWVCGSSAVSWRERDMLIVDVGTVPVPGRKPGSPVPAVPEALPVATAGGGEGREGAVPADPPAPVPGVPVGSGVPDAPEGMVAEAAVPGPGSGPPVASPDPAAPMDLVPGMAEAVRPGPRTEQSPPPLDGTLEAAVRESVGKVLAAFEAERTALPARASSPPAAVPSAGPSVAPSAGPPPSGSSAGPAASAPPVPAAMAAADPPAADPPAADPPAADPPAADPPAVDPPAVDPDEPATIGMMDVSAWGEGDRAARIADLIQTAGTAEGETRVAALIELARLHLAHAMPEEGLAAVDAAGDEGTPGQRRALGIVGDALRVLRGGADPSGSVFVRLDPPVSADHRLWRAAALAGPGAGEEGWRKARLDLPEALRRLLAYPGDLRARLLTRLADGAAAQGDADSLDRIVIEMLTMDAGFAQDRRLDFYRGLVAELRADTPVALARYDAAAEAAGPFGRRAQLRAVELRRQSGELDEAGAVEALERLRFAWRGDEVEASTLEALGQAYLRAGRTDLVLEMLDRIGRHFAGTRRGHAAAASARTLTASLIDQPGPGTAAQMLFLIRRHGDLIAVADGDGSLRRRLAARLAERGFSLEAGRLLASLAEEGPEAGREEAGLDLAALMLRTGRPGDALTVLSRTEGAVDDASDPRRALLRGEALSLSHRPLEALEVLRGLPGVGAARLRARILFAAGEWRAAASAYGDALDLEGAAAPRADDVARFGLSSFRAGDLPAVRDAAARYRPVLAGTRWAGLLDILAADPEPFDPAFLGEDEVARQLALADGILGLAGRWAGPAGSGGRGP